MTWKHVSQSVFNPTKHRFAAVFGNSPTHIPNLPFTRPVLTARHIAGKSRTSYYKGFTATVAHSEDILDFDIALN